jgi:hypothetical protein
MLRLIVLFAALLPTVSVFAQPASPVEKPDIEVGDRWIFRSVDLWKNEETSKIEYKVTGANGDNIELERTRIDAATGSPVGRPARRKADRSTWTFVDPKMTEGKYVTFAFPLEVGKTWEFEYSIKAANGDSVSQKRTAKVESWEDVVVPAGHFKALKVVHSGQYTRSTPTTSLSGTVSEVLWYAPSVKRFVKREYRDATGSGQTWDHVRDELIEYEVK